tara:strand:+ start:907 stop:1167 length:261 start_codon:yes stop_codon:yes gene_type:complete
MNRIEKIRAVLEQSLQPHHLEVIDESHLHVGHQGAKSGKGHFRVIIISELFKNIPQIKRHKMVFKALGELLNTDIHAISLDTKTPN